MGDLRKYISDWLLFCKKSFTANTYRQYNWTAKKLLESIENNGQELTADAVEHFLDEKLQNGSRKTYNGKLIAVRCFAVFLEKKYNIPNHIKNIPFLNENPPKQRVLNEDEYQLLLDNTKGIDRDIIIWLGNTGLRKSEFANLKWSDVSTDEKYLTITGKGRKRRVIPLNDHCREVLSHYNRLNPQDSMQFSIQYPGMESISWLIRRTTRRLNIPRAGSHAVRHYFATTCIKHGVSIYKLSKILGHSSVSTTESIYIHISPQDLMGELDCLD